MVENHGFGSKAGYWLLVRLYQLGCFTRLYIQRRTGALKSGITSNPPIKEINSISYVDIVILFFFAFFFLPLGVHFMLLRAPL
jgi:hypothetical protein